MMSKLSSKEFVFLSNNFSLTKEKYKAKKNCIRSEEFLDEKKCLSILEELSICMNSSSLKITASLLSKRISYLAIFPALYSLSVYNKGLDLSLKNCFLDYNFDNNLWLSKLPIKDLNVSQLDVSNNRNKFREEIIRNLFLKHLFPLLNVLCKVSSVSEHIIWENMAVRLYSLYDKKISKEENDDFSFLLNIPDYKAKEFFGISFNPIKYFNTYKIKNRQTNKFSIRKTCCYYYKVSLDNEYCKNCPLS